MPFIYITQITLIKNDIAREFEIKEDAKSSLLNLLTEEKKLKSSQYKDALATSIYRAIEKYQETLDTD